MKKASMILGITGGVLAILIAVIVILVTFFIGALAYRNDPPYDGYFEEMEDKPLEIQEVMEIIRIIAVRLIILDAGILGIVGASIVKWKNELAGIFMIISSVATLFTLWAIISFPLFLLGGIFALIQERPVSLQHIPVENNINNA